MASKIGTAAALQGAAVRISIPASVAYDLNKFKKSIASFAERLGCPTCVSGLDCTFQMERDFVVGERLDVTVLAAGATATVLAEGTSRARGITVDMPTDVTNNLKKVLKVADSIGRRLGTHGAGVFCCSGFDITFQRELQFLADRNGNVRTISERS